MEGSLLSTTSLCHHHKIFPHRPLNPMQSDVIGLLDSISQRTAHLLGAASARDTGLSARRAATSVTRASDRRSCMACSMHVRRNRSRSGSHVLSKAVTQPSSLLHPLLKLHQLGGGTVYWSPGIAGDVGTAWSAPSATTGLLAYLACRVNLFPPCIRTPSSQKVLVAWVLISHQCLFQSYLPAQRWYT